MDRAYDLPSRAEMEAGLAAFAERAGLEARYGCTWESTRYEGEQLVLETSDGEYRCRAAVFALGVTEPWRAEVPGLEHAAHYVDTRVPERYAGRDVFVVGKRNSGFEVAQGILPWARSIVLGSPRPVQTDALALSALRVRYLHPYDEYARGGPGTYVIDVTIERIERVGERLRVSTRGTTWDGALEFEVDDVIAATGFQTPLQDLPQLGLVTVADGRIPALTPFWESVSLPGVFFAGNASQGARGIGKHGAGASSSSVNGFRYNARVLARHLAERLDGREPARDAGGRGGAVPAARADGRARAVGAEGLSLPRRLGGRRLLRGRGRRPALVVPRLGRARRVRRDASRSTRPARSCRCSTSAAAARSSSTSSSRTRCTSTRASPTATS